MNKRSKLAKIFISGFILIGIMTLFISNMGAINSIRYKEKQEELEALEKIYEEASDFESVSRKSRMSLENFRAFLNDGINRGLYEEENYDYIEYVKEMDINQLVYSNQLDENQQGKIYFAGNMDDASRFARKEMYTIGELFYLVDLYTEKSESFIGFYYYSQNNFIGSFPNQEDQQIDFAGVRGKIENANKVIEEVNQLPIDVYNKMLVNGWENSYYNEESSGNRYSISLPVNRNNRVIGIVQLVFDQEKYYQLDRYLEYDKYLVNDDNQMLFTSNKAIGNREFENYVFDYYNGLHIYKNKFPVDYEVRREDGYKVYIINKLVGSDRLIYIKAFDNSQGIIEILVDNVLLIIVIIGVIYLISINDNKHGNKLELFIKKSQYDGMTQLFNHEHIMSEVNRYKESKRIKQISVLMMDIDNFKSVNDNYGHTVGDQVIRLCAQSIREVVNKLNASCGRYGGEEFLVLLPRMKEEKALKVANDIRILFNEKCKLEMNMDTTISVGLHVYEKPSQLTEKEIVNCADRNLYEAKRKGKNCVVKDKEMESK